MMHVKVLGTELNLNSAIFGRVLNRCACYKVAGRCESLIENRPCSLNTREHYIVCMFPPDIPITFV